MSTIIEINGLTKQYGQLTALNNLSLTVEQGAVVGFIGPNGAGKTTTMRILTTLLQPTSGQAWLVGFSVTSQPRDVRRVVGYMPDFFGVYEDMKVWEYLDFFAAAYKIPREKRIQIINDVLELTDLQVKREDFVEALSRGMKQRLCLAKTLVHDPEVLLLDEPASGLDPRARVEMRELLKELRRMGKTILISSHILSELADFCNKIGIIEKGQLLLSGDVREIREKIRGERAVRITLRQRAEEAEQLLLALPGVAGVTREDSTVRVAVTADLPDAGELIRVLVEHGFVVTACHEESADLEDIFMRITKGLVA